MVVTLPLLLVLLFAVAGFASLVAGVVAMFGIRRSLARQVERNGSTSFERAEPGDVVQRQVRLRRAAVVANFAPVGLFLAFAAIALTTLFLESNLDDIVSHGTQTTATVVGARANAARQGRSPYTISYRYQAGQGLYTGVAGVDSKSMLEAYIRESTIPIVYSSVHPSVSRPGSRASAAAALQRSRRTSVLLSALFAVVTCGFAALAWRSMRRALRLASSGELRYGTILEVTRHARGRLRAIVSIEDALGPRLHTWHTSRYIALVPPVQDASIAVLADRTDPKLIEIYEAVQRWVVIERSDRASGSQIVDL